VRSLSTVSLFVPGVLSNTAMFSAPRVMLMASGGQSVKALTGPADHCRQELQWQYAMAAGSPRNVNCTPPQKQLV
jgi:hypothetical protein